MSSNELDGRLGLDSTMFKMSSTEVQMVERLKQYNVQHVFKGSGDGKWLRWHNIQHILREVEMLEWYKQSNVQSAYQGSGPDIIA